MEIIVFVIFLIIVVVAIELLKSNKPRAEKGLNYNQTWPFYASRIMTEPEQTLYWKLQQCLPNHIIAVQVQASRVIRVKKGNNYGEWFNRINRLSYDFVICDKSSKPIAAIELDDSSHAAPKRQETDKRKNKATEDAGIKIIRWKINNVPSDTEIKELFTKIS